jgi:hypothetical protein
LSGGRIVLLCAVALALFCALYSLAAWYDWWPRLPPGALHDSDLWAGMLGGSLLLYCLIRASGGDTEKGKHGDAEKGGHGDTEKGGHGDAESS